MACRQRGIVGYVDSNRDRIASEVSDLVRRAPFAFECASRCNGIGEASGASGLSAVALVMVVSVGGRSNCGLRREGGCKEEQ